MATYIFSQTHTAPELVSIFQAKKQLKLEADFDDENDLIEDYINAAIVDCENYTGTSIFEAKYIIKTSAWENNFKLMVSPVQSITAITYLDINGATQTLSTELYELRPVDKYVSEVYFLDFSNLPTLKASTTNTISIAVTTGYVAATLPKAIKQAILLKTTNYYENRNDSVEVLTKASENLLRKYRFYY